MAEWLTHVSGVQIQAQPNLIFVFGIKLPNLFFRGGEFRSYRLGFAFYIVKSFGSFFAKIKLLDGFLCKP